MALFRRSTELPTCWWAHKALVLIQALAVTSAGARARTVVLSAVHADWDEAVTSASNEKLTEVMVKALAVICSEGLGGPAPRPLVRHRAVQKGGAGLPEGEALGRQSTASRSAPVLWAAGWWPGTSAVLREGSPPRWGWCAFGKAGRAGWAGRCWQQALCSAVVLGVTRAASHKPNACFFCPLLVTGLHPITLLARWRQVP